MQPPDLRRALVQSSNLTVYVVPNCSELVATPAGSHVPVASGMAEVLGGELHCTQRAGGE